MTEVGAPRVTLASKGRAPLDRRDALLFAAVTGVAFVLRWIFVHQLQSYPWFTTPPVDEGVHHAWGLAFAAGEPYAEAPFFRAPLYPWFLGSLYSLLGPDLYAVRVAQALLGALTCGLVFLAGRLAFGRAIGAVSGLAAASYWVLLYFDAALLIPVLSGFLHLVLLCTLLLAHRRRSTWLWAGAGVALGLAAIARPNVLLFAPFVAAWALLGEKVDAARERPSWKQRLRAAGALTLGALAPVLPVTWHNVSAGDDWVLISSQGGVNFHIGNQPGADGISVSQQGQANTWEPWYAEQRARAESAEGRSLKPSEISDWYFARAWEFILGSPGESLPLLARKALYFVSYREIPNNQDLHFVAEEYTPVARWLPLGFWIVGPLGALGLLLALRRRDLFPLWGFVLVYSASVIAFFVTARFRVPVLPPLLILATYASAWLGNAAREKRWRALGAGLLVLGAAAWPVSQVPPGVDTLGILPRRSMALHLFANGRAGEAEPLLEELLARAARAGVSPDAPTWTAAGSLRSKRGDVEGARAAFESALLRDRDYSPALVGRSHIAETEGDFDAAGRDLLRAIQIDAGQAKACVGFAQRLAARGFRPAAVGFLEAALKSRPEAAPLQQALAALRAG